MNFKIGDKISVIDGFIKGKVIKVKGEIIFVASQDGMEYQFHSKELVKIPIEQKELTKYSDINNNLLKQKVQEPKKKTSSFKKMKNEVVMEVDLHIEKLVKSTKGMDNFDILTTQIDTAKRKIEYCIQKKISKIVFIHGVGEGVLKTELHLLLNNYAVKYYDASYQKYGLGATEVYVYQNENI